MIARNLSQYKAKTDLLSSTLKTAIFYMYNNGSCFYKGDKVQDRREEKMFQKADFCVCGCLAVDKSKSLAGLTITHAVYVNHYSCSVHHFHGQIQRGAGGLDLSLWKITIKWL